MSGGVPRSLSARAALLLAVAGGAFALGAPVDCDSALTVSPAGRFTDACGRERYFRGINLVDKGFPYVYSTTEYVPGLSATPADAALFQSFGWNGIRLGVLWQGAMPERGVLNTTYLSALVSLSQLMHGYSILSLLDAHQDLLSPAFCADGLPAWLAIELAQGSAPFPEPLAAPFVIDNTTGLPTAGCGDFSWSTFYFTSAVGRGFQNLYTQPSAIAYAQQFWAGVITAYASTPGGWDTVLASELLNEPWSGDALADPLLLVPGIADRTLLQPFYANLSTAIRAAEAAAGVPPKPIAVESITFDDFFPVGFDAIPGGHEGGAVLSFHYYSLPNIEGAKGQVEARVADSLRLGGAPFLTEFDLSLPNPVNPPYTAADMQATLDACDAGGVGYLGWDSSCIYYGNGSLVLPAVQQMTRPFPLAVAGVSSGYGTNSTTRVFSLAYNHSAAATAPTVVFVSCTELWYAEGAFSVSVVASPAGAVAATTQLFNGCGNATDASARPLGEGYQRPDGSWEAPAPFPYAYIVLSRTASAPAGQNVPVQLNIAPAAGRE